MIGSVATYTGGLLAFVGVIALIRPFRFARLHTRRRGAAVIAGGLALAGVALVWPAREARVQHVASQLDRIIPRFQFSELHETTVHAPPAAVYRAVREVTANEIRFFRTLIWIRRFGRDGPEDILNAPEHMPILDVATSTTFLQLADTAPHEIVVGTLVIAPPGEAAKPRTAEAFTTLDAPGYAKAVMNFRIEEDSDGNSRLTTETRVFATDVASRRRFAAYWRVIMPGSALIRRSWLAAVRRRAERDH